MDNDNMDSPLQTIQELANSFSSASENSALGLAFLLTVTTKTGKKRELDEYFLNHNEKLWEECSAEDLICFLEYSIILGNKELVELVIDRISRRVGSDTNNISRKGYVKIYRSFLQMKDREPVNSLFTMLHGPSGLLKKIESKMMEKSQKFSELLSTFREMGNLLTPELTSTIMSSVLSCQTEDTNQQEKKV